MAQVVAKQPVMGRKKAKIGCGYKDWKTPVEYPPQGPILPAPLPTN